MALRFVGRVQAGVGDASRWLTHFNAAYARTLGMPIFPGSLNVALPAPFDWFAPGIAARTQLLRRADYAGERDILLVPCCLENLQEEPAWLWSTTTAAQDRDDPWVIEILAARSLRHAFQLVDGAAVTIRLTEPRVVPADGAASDERVSGV